MGRPKGGGRRIKAPPDVGYLKGLLRYDPEVGTFTRIRKAGKAQAGTVAGIKAKQGYIKICVHGFDYMAHRLAWLYVHGTWPEEIDHINRLRDDNRISNLRAATGSENRCNRPSKNESKGLPRGVRWDDKANRWHARIQWGRKTIHIGKFKDLAEASAAYNQRARQLHGDFAVLNNGAVR